MQVLNKHDKVELVIRLHHEGKTIRDIASAAHMSFSDIGKIIHRTDGITSDADLRSKTIATQGLHMFNNGKTPIEVAIELDISYSEVEELQQEYWALKELYDLAFAYMEIKNDLPSFMKLFKLLKQNKCSEKNTSQKY